MKHSKEYATKKKPLKVYTLRLDQDIVAYLRLKGYDINEMVRTLLAEAVDDIQRKKKNG